jgi:hypothetical protein
MNNGQSSLVANAESIPENTSEVNALDQSEKEYNRMISQHTTYHRMMMDDLMKLTTESGSQTSVDQNSNCSYWAKSGECEKNPNYMLNSCTASCNSVNKMSIVSGLGTTVQNLDASNEQLLQTAGQYADQGKQRAITATNLNAYMNETGLKLRNDIKAYDEIIKKEGFSNPTMDAALEISEIMSESQKYALVIFGAFALFLLHKTIKHL